MPPNEQDGNGPVAPGDERPIPFDAADPEAGNKLKHTMTRASIPLDRPASMHSRRRSTMETAGEGEADMDDAVSEYQWGPLHPCFPHPNPHVPLISPLYDTTRIIRIKRDWMVVGDLAPTFANLYPEILDPLIPEDTFRELIRKVNTELIAAFNPLSFRSWFDTVMGVATFWLWDDAGFTAIKKRLSNLEQWLEEWNRRVGVKEGVRIIPLRRTG